MTHAERHDKLHSPRDTFKCVFGNGLDSELLSLPGIETLIALARVAIAAAALFAIYGFGRVAQRNHGSETLALPLRDDETPPDRAMVPLLKAHAAD